MDLAKKSLMRETEYLILAAQNNAIRTNHMKARIEICNKIEHVGYVVIKTKRSIS